MSVCVCVYVFPSPVHFPLPAQERTTHPSTTHPFTQQDRSLIVDTHSATHIKYIYIYIHTHRARHPRSKQEAAANRRKQQPCRDIALPSSSDSSSSSPPSAHSHMHVSTVPPYPRRPPFRSLNISTSHPNEQRNDLLSPRRPSRSPSRAPLIKVCMYVCVCVCVCMHVCKCRESDGDVEMERDKYKPWLKNI
jgi:hypothetical protein